MKSELFYKELKNVILESYSNSVIINTRTSILLKHLDLIIKDNQINELVKLTEMTILFEGFYQCVQEESKLKILLIQVRLNRWKNHYGTPTLIFLLSYHSEIEKTLEFFQNESNSVDILNTPWKVRYKTAVLVDDKNAIIVNQEFKNCIDMPVEDEKTGEFIKTHNPSGGYATTPCDPVSRKFIEYIDYIAKSDTKVLEIGAAFGAATLEALAKNVTVFCNDVDINNLSVVRNRYLKRRNNQQATLTGDDENLVFIPGSFPDELLGLPENYFDAILICRVLHFFTGDKIEQSLERLSFCLKPEGKLFIVCETPYLKNWKKFIPEYEERVLEGLKWPGEITNPAEYENSGRANSLPSFVHWITKEILERSLNNSKLNVEHLSYINRNGQFPSDLLLDGRESVGAIAVKR